MTTRPSSSRRGAVTTSTTLIDSISRPIRLGAEIGRGGEGSVFEVEGQPSLVAKVYHKRPLHDSHIAKLQAMAASWNGGLDTISAWPRSVLYDPAAKRPCGILIARMTDARPLHELYGTSNRRRHFPETGWHHLILAARNTAAAFQTLHAAGIVVGDVNQGNLLVDKQMCVRMIDCDSFQITHGQTTFNCPVGTPHFTPPELQSLKLREVVRTVNHDRFGLAVLIFHLLFVGRHPFAGRYRGPNDLPIEKAIAERRFAFSKNSAQTMMEPPPYSLLLDDIPGGMAQLFEAAFRCEDNGMRPTAVAWVEQLEGLLKQRRACTFDPLHIYYAPLAECPWCRIEDGGGPTFFVSSGGSAVVSADRLTALEERVFDLRDVEFPDLPPSALAMPQLLKPIRLKPSPAKSWPDYAALLLVGCWMASVACAFVSGPALAAVTLIALVATGLLLFGKKGRARRLETRRHIERLSRDYSALDKLSETIEFQHLKRKALFAKSKESMAAEIQRFRAKGEQLRDVFVEHREMQKSDYLRGFIIRDNMRSIPGITNSQVAILESYGVESSNELDRIRLYAVPSVDSELVMELLQWRTQTEMGFVFNPEHGVQLADLASAKEIAVRRFKISQARKILTAAKQLETLAETGKIELARSMRPFEAANSQWKELARQFRDFQSSRLALERFTNNSPLLTLCLTFSVSAIAAILYLFSR